MTHFASGQTAGIAKAFVLGLCVVGLIASSLYACQEYDASLLKYAEPGADASAEPEAAETGPEVASDSAAESSTEAAIEAAAEAGADAASDALEEEALPACSATLVDCDGELANGCETDLGSDPHHCGACGHDCLGGGCDAGRCLPQELATGQKVPSAVTLDDAYVYWTNQGAPGEVMRVSKSGGTPELVGQSLTPGGLAVDSTSVYWSELVDKGTVWRLDKSQIGQTAQPIALAQNQGLSASLAVDEKEWVYFTTPSQVKRVPKNGGPIQLMATGQDQPAGMVVDLLSVYWTTLLGGTVCTSDKPDAGVQIIASGLTYPMGLTSDLGNLYWTTYMGAPDGGTPQVMMIAKINMAQPVVLAADQASPMGIAQSGPYVFWTNNVGGTVMRVPKVGGTPELLASGQEAPAGIAVDAERVYWSNRDSGQILSLAR